MCNYSIAGFFLRSLQSFSPSGVYLWHCKFSSSTEASCPAPPYSQWPLNIQSTSALYQCPKSDTSPTHSPLRKQNTGHMFLSSPSLLRKKLQVVHFLLIMCWCVRHSKSPNPLLYSDQSLDIQTMLVLSVLSGGKTETSPSDSPSKIWNARHMFHVSPSLCGSILRLCYFYLCWTVLAATSPPPFFCVFWGPQRCKVYSFCQSSKWGDTETSASESSSKNP